MIYEHTYVYVCIILTVLKLNIHPEVYTYLYKSIKFSTYVCTENCAAFRQWKLIISNKLFSFYVNVNTKTTKYVVFFYISNYAYIEYKYILSLD